MNYIVMDLEWNQCPWGKDKENKELPFEIVEIGAVKLDENRQYVSEFHELIFPVVYTELHRVTKNIIKLTMEDLKCGRKFVEVIRDFFEWCGKDCIFGTWGSMDLTEFQRNLKFFGIEHDFGMPFLYYDIQKIYSLCYDDGKSRLSLENAIEERGLEKDLPFHAAIYDALYTARIFEGMDFDKVSTYTSVDTFVVPKTRKDEFTINYGTYSKYVSHGFDDRDIMMKDPVVLSSKCYLCGKNARKKIRWFSTNQKMYYCLAYCPEHGYIRGKMKLKKTDNDLYFVTKVLKITDESGAWKIREKQILAREKRRERRLKEKERERINHADDKK